MERWPDFFIVGAPRCGTTSLYEYLRKTDGIFMSQIKEPNYFSRSVIPDDYIFAPIRDKEKYLNLFKKATNNQLVGESTSTYHEDPGAPSLIHEANPDARIIIMIRDPIERAFSHYLYFLSMGIEKRDFSKAIKENEEGKDLSTGRNYLNSSLYSNSIQKYFDLFGKNNVIVIIFDDFKNDTKKMFEDVLKFLNLDSQIPEDIDTIYNKYSLPRGNISKKILQSTTITRLARKFIPVSIRINVREKIITKNASSKPSINHKDKYYLKPIFSEDIKSLEKILEYRVPWSENYS